MPKIDLTTRKAKNPDGSLKNPPPARIGSHTFDGDDYVGRYSAAYQPAGHDFLPSFKVLRLAYWLKYHIIGQDDVATYETLLLLCERAIPFTVEKLAEEMGIGDATLRKRLDNLVNAELLEILKSDGQGSPNFYLLRTPYFEQHTFNDSVEDRITKGGFPLPETFLEDMAEELADRVKANRAKRERQMLKAGDTDEAIELAAEQKTKILTWFRIVKNLGSKQAADLNNYIWKLAKSNFSKLESYSFDAELRDRIAKHLKKGGYAFNQVYFNYVAQAARNLFYFYSPRLLAAAGGPSLRRAAAPPIAPVTFTAIEEETRSPVAVELPPEQAEAWENVSADLRARLNRDVYSTWFDAAVCDGIDDAAGIIRLRAGQVARDWISMYYADLLDEVLTANGMDGYKVEWHIEPETPLRE